MARYTDADCKLCRREGQKLFLKGAKCYSEKCPVSKRAYAPGQHGQMRKKITGYGQQLREKQKARRYYGVLESQFRKYFDMAEHMHGIAGENLLRLLESRLDNVVYRLGFAMSRDEARQLVRHGHFTVNGKKVNIPSYLIKEGDTIAVKEKSRQYDKFKNVNEANSARPIPKWLEVDREKMEGKAVSLASRDDIDLQVEEHRIVELYSK